MDDSTFRIPIGPQHPFLKEPAKFDFDIHGEEIVGARMNIGYNHRGIEKACEARNYYQCLYLLERICGICSHSHTTAFIAGGGRNHEAGSARSAASICARWCANWNGFTAICSGLASRPMRSASTRCSCWSGATANSSWTSWRRSAATASTTRSTPSAACGATSTTRSAKRSWTCSCVLKKRLDYYAQIGTNEASFVGRIQGVGKLPTKRAAEMCAVGPFARASAVDVDVRRDDPYAAYKELDFKVITSDSCDILRPRDRARPRNRGILQDDRTAADESAGRGDRRRQSVRAKRRPGVAVSRYEAPRGEDVHFVRGNGTDKPERVRVRAPTMANLEAATESVVGAFVADIPIAIASIDPCFSCTDRMAIVLRDRKNGTRVTTWEELRRYGIDWYGKNKGIRF